MSGVAAAYDRLQGAVEELRVAAESALATDDEMLSVLTVAEGVARQLDHLTVSTVAGLQRRGVFAARGYKKPGGALGDLLGLERFEARRRVVAAEHTCAPSWCEIHHILEWEHHGRTKLPNLVMLCKVHHRLIHYSGWEVRIRDGMPEFIPPRWIDPDRRPRRNPQHDAPRAMG